MNRTILLLSIFLVVWGSCRQTPKLCCDQQTATASFASLGADINFQNAHESPGSIIYAEKGKTISFPTPDGKNGNAYYIPAPSKSNNYIFVFHEWWGLNEFVKRQSDLYSDSVRNVNVIALDLYDGQLTTDPEEAAKIMQSINEERAKNIIKGALNYAGKNAQIATVGWCFGGGWSMQGALLCGNQTKGCVMYYGMPENNIDKLKTLNSDVIFIFPKRDKWINEQVKEEFVSNMQKAGKKLTVKEYDADHAFANPSNRNFNNEAAADAQKITLDYLRSHLK